MIVYYACTQLRICKRIVYTYIVSVCARVHTFQVKQVQTVRALVLTQSN